MILLKGSDEFTVRDVRTDGKWKSITTCYATYFRYLGGDAKEVVGPLVGASTALRTRDDVSFVDICKGAGAAPPSSLFMALIAPEENIKPTPPTAFALFVSSAVAVASPPRAGTGRVQRNIMGFAFNTCLASIASTLDESVIGTVGSEGVDTFWRFAGRVSVLSVAEPFFCGEVDTVAPLALSAASTALRFAPPVDRS